jgi:AcrR family transcriptional regulator
MAKACRNRDVLVERAAALFASRPAEQLGFNAIADACGVSMWALRYNFGDTETLFRAVADHLIDRIDEAAHERPQAGRQTIEGLSAHAAFLAGLFEGEAYRDLLLLVLRAGRERPWLREAYEERVLGKLASGVEAAVAERGRSRDGTILMREGAARRFVRRLETAFALAPLLPAGASPTSNEREQVLREATREAFEATYLIDLSVPAAA